MMDTIITKKEQEILVPLIEEFIEAAPVSQPHLPVKEITHLLFNKMKEHLQERSDEEIMGYAEEITETVQRNDTSLAELTEHRRNGKSRESWIHSKLKNALAKMSQQKQNEYLNSLDAAVKKANQNFENTVTNTDGSISALTNLDGMIAEQYHADTFNLNAAAKGSSAIADVPQVNTKNSMDIGVRLTPGGTPDARYQLKYGKTAEETIKYIKKGDYRNQQLIVPAEQVAEVQAAFPNRKVSSVIDFDGIQGNTLTKAEAKSIQAKAQNGEAFEYDWNQYNIKLLSNELTKQTGKAALIGAVIGASTEIIEKKKSGEDIDPKDVAKAALENGSDFAVKCMAAGALKVASEKGIINAIPKGTPAGQIANIVFVGIENAKIMFKVAKGEYTISEGLEKMHDTTCSVIGGLICSAKGTALGTKIGAAVGSIVPGSGTAIGAAVGGIVGGVVGYMAGSSIGKAVSAGARKLGSAARSVVKSAVSAVKSVFVKAAAKCRQ